MEHAGGEESLYELPSARYTVTLKYTEDLMSVVILDEPLTAEGGNRRSEESGGTWGLVSTRWATFGLGALLRARGLLPTC